MSRLILQALGDSQEGGRGPMNWNRLKTHKRVNWNRPSGHKRVNWNRSDGNRRASWGRVDGRNKFRKAQPSRWRWGGVEPSRAGGAYNRVYVEGMISSSRRVIHNLPGVTSDELERWWHIENNLLPPDEEKFYHRLTDDEMEEIAVDETRPIEQWGRDRSDDEREETRMAIRREEEIIDNLEDRARRLDDLAARGDVSASFEAQDIREQEIPAHERAIEILHEDLGAALEDVANKVRDQREDLKVELKHRQEVSIERAEARLEDLKGEMHNEIQAACDRYFEEDGLFELENYELS